MKSLEREWTFWDNLWIQSDSSQPLRDCSQTTFVHLTKFWLSKSPFTLLYLTDNIKLDGIPTKIKWKIQACSILYLKFFEDTSVKSYKIQLPVLLFLVLRQFLYQQKSIFYNFLKLRSALFEKDFRHKFSFCNRFTQTSHPLNGQNMLSVTKVFCQFSLKCLLKLYWKNPAKASFIYQQWTVIVHIFLKVSTTDSLVFFLEHFKNSYFDTSISNYLKIKFLEFFLY